MQDPRKHKQQAPAPGNTQQADDSEDLPAFEGVHQGVILSDQWGNEWDDTDDFNEIDFRLVDGPD